MSKSDLVKQFEKDYPQTDKDNKKLLTIRRIIELESKGEDMNFSERTELISLKQKVKKL